MNRDIVVGKYTLETLTNGMYSNPLDLYREYIQNAVDSIDEKIKKVEDTVEHYKIDIQIEPLSGTISIRDVPYVDCQKVLFYAASFSSKMVVEENFLLLRIKIRASTKCGCSYAKCMATNTQR